jgi:hypothetical protein
MSRVVPIRAMLTATICRCLTERYLESRSRIPRAEARSPEFWARAGGPQFVVQNSLVLRQAGFTFVGVCWVLRIFAGAKRAELTRMFNGF